MPKITVTVDHPDYDEPLEYSGVSLSVKEGLTEPVVRLDGHIEGEHTLHRLALVSDVSLE